MTTNSHASSNELLAALREPDRAASTLEHTNGCLACRVRLSRIRHASGFAPAGGDSLQRILEASTRLPQFLAAVANDKRSGEPQPNEVWRVGRNEALLVWVRQVFEDGAADVIPLVLDVELADQESVLVGADATPLETETVAMVSLRTHVHTGAFLNRVGILDIGKDVTEVMTAVREGRRPSGVRVGPPIDDDDDQRLEYRQALRDLLAEISPSAWLEPQDGVESSTEQRTSSPVATQMPGDIDAIQARLYERLQGVQCRTLPHTVTVAAPAQIVSVFKVMYLDTVILVAALQGANVTGFPEVTTVAAACQQMTFIEPDVDAVAIAIPQDDWQTLLFTTANMRKALELPGGLYRGPTPTLEGYGLVDTLCKHLEGVVAAWDVIERTSSHIGITNLHQIAARHASTSIGSIIAEGRRARQAAKQTAWQNLPNELSEQVARFIVAVARKESIEDALVELTLEISGD